MKNKINLNKINGLYQSNFNEFSDNMIRFGQYWLNRSNNLITGKQSGRIYKRYEK